MSKTIIPLAFSTDRKPLNGGTYCIVPPSHIHLLYPRPGKPQFYHVYEPRFRFPTDGPIDIRPSFHPKGVRRGILPHIPFLLHSSKQNKTKKTKTTAFIILIIIIIMVSTFQPSSSNYGYDKSLYFCYIIIVHSVSLFRFLFRFSIGTVHRLSCMSLSSCL